MQKNGTPEHHKIEYADLGLDGTYRLQSGSDRKINTPINLPGDVHTALMDADKISDPYFGANEQKAMWVNNTPWTIEGMFDVPDEMVDGFLTLTLSNVDCIASVFLNDDLVLEAENFHIRYDLDVTGKIKPGENMLRFEFAVTREVAKARADAHPFPIPFTKNYQTNGLEGVHMNFVRKPACHAGWDWGICLMPTGVYGEMRLRRSNLARQESVQVDQEHTADSVVLTIKTRIFAFDDGEVELAQTIDGQTLADTVKVSKGENVVTQTATINNPNLWWPAGQGTQPLYELTTDLDGEITHRKLGLRKLEWVVEKDEIDHSFKCRVNGRDITMMGANWIPADAIPSRITPETVRDLIESATAANMNMLRIWGGGQYEPDYFYEMCDELGVLIWHDFMFSCMSYPSDRAFLASVRTEITQQIHRLSHHACIALWCGDNEVIGSLSWYPETKADPERYVANYDRLNNMLGQITEDEDPARRFWPSSPSLGYLDFSDGWHSDTRGDIHYWDVWHSAKSFEAYRTVNPRFASEFGFQSFTSSNIIESFTEPKDRNPSSPVMETHQRNDGGNARILETMCRYFRFPKGFDEMVFLSQVQQGLAIKTAIEYWRSTKPRCMGTLYWQINDTWPVHSWASLDYGGQWKLLHYMAKRFFQLQNVVAVPDVEENEIVLKGVNDAVDACNIKLDVLAVKVSGEKRQVHKGNHTLDATKADMLFKLPLAQLEEDEFLFFSWTDSKGELLGENDFFPKAYKNYEIQSAKVNSSWSHEGDKPVLTLTTDKPSFFVTATTDLPGYFSDNAITLLPGRETKLTFTPRLNAEVTLSALEKRFQVRHLKETY